MISGFSAAALNPKFVFDKEPYIILTYKLFEKGLMDEMTHLPYNQQEEMLGKMLLDAYREKSKIYLPETLEELIENLHEINEKIENNGKAI